MRGLPEPSGSGPRDVIHALLEVLFRVQHRPAGSRPPAVPLAGKPHPPELLAASKEAPRGGTPPPSMRSTPLRTSGRWQVGAWLGSAGLVPGPGAAPVTLSGDRGQGSRRAALCAAY
jgi:hypothetical protein